MYNFISTFDELNKLYEDDCLTEAYDKDTADKPVEESVGLGLGIAAAGGALGAGIAAAGGSAAAAKVASSLSESDEDPTDEASSEETAEDEPRQVICECDKCGALMIKDEADIVVDEETDLVNVEDECQFCEEANGFKIVGIVAPYEVAEEAVDAPIEDEEAFEDSVEPAVEFDETDIIDEDLADVFRKKFDKPASIKTQQAWEDEITDLYLKLEHETDERKIAKIKKRIEQLKAKFDQQVDWEKRSQKQEGLLDNVGNVNIDLALDGGEGNDVDVLG